MRKIQFITYIRDLPSFVNVAAIVSLLSLLLLKLWLFKVSAIFPGANDLGDLYYELCLATAGAVIFYIGVNHIPSVQRKKKVAVYVNNMIVGKVSKTLTRISSEITGDYGHQLSLEQILVACKRIDPRTECAIDQILYQNWYEAIDRYHAEMREYLRDLLLLSETFSAEMLEAITNLENQFTVFNIARGRYVGNNSLEMWGHALYSCHVAYNRLYIQLRREFGHYY